MMTFAWLDPEHRDWLLGQRLGSLAEISRHEGELVSDGHRGRATRRVDTDDGRRVYVKIETQTRGKDLARHALAGRGWWTKSRAEFAVLKHLHEHGIGCPRALACFQSGWPRPQACLVLDELRDYAGLHTVLAPAAAHSSDERTALCVQLGREVARLHAAGVSQPDLYGNHVFARREADAWQVALIDFQRSSVARRVSTAERVRDLGGLWATIPPRLLAASEWELLLGTYLEQAQLSGGLASWQERIVARGERLLARRKIWEIRESDTAEHRAVQRLEPTDEGRMWIDQHSRDLLTTSGLSDFRAVMTTTQGRLLRTLRDRENWRLELHDTHQKIRGAYLKKHHVRSLGTRLRALVGAGPGETAGRVEAVNVTRLGRGGIAAMRLLAYGEQLHDDGRLESFVLTEELTGYTQLDHFLRARFAPQPAEAAPRDGRLARLIDDVADVAARFHRLGYNHRDLYCCHFFIREAESGRFQVNLIDLQRVEHRRWRRRRWLVKDLAQLGYSAPRDRIGCTQRLAFIKRYLGVEKLRPRDKQFIRRVLLKQRLMELTEGPHP